LKCFKDYFKSCHNDTERLFDLVSVFSFVTAASFSTVNEIFQMVADEWTIAERNAVLVKLVELYPDYYDNRKRTVLKELIVPIMNVAIKRNERGLIDIPIVSELYSKVIGSPDAGDLRYTVELIQLVQCLVKLIQIEGLPMEYQPIEYVFNSLKL